MHRYFKKIDSLKLTQEQEIELGNHWGLIVSMANRYSTNGPLTSIDDMIQMAAVRLAVVIKNKSSKDHKAKLGYYSTIIKNACISLLRNTYRSQNMFDNIDDIEEPISNSDVDNIPNKIYIDKLLDNIKSKHNKDILIHYYGIGTAPINPILISDIVPLDSRHIAVHRNWAIKMLQQKVKKERK